MNTPQYLVGLMVKRANYTVGRVLKEAGLGKYPLDVFINNIIAMDRFGSRLHNDIAYMQDLSRHR